MGKTFSTGLLTNGLAQDSSNNIGIGGAANASFKLQVTGATNLTGALTGTSAAFTGNMGVGGATTEIGGFTSLTISNSSNGSFLDLNNSGTNNLRFLSLNSSDQRIQAQGSLRFDAGGVNRFSLGSAGNIVLGFDNGANNKYISIAPIYTSAATPPNIQGVNAGVGAYDISLNASGGKVGVGTSAIVNDALLPLQINAASSSQAYFASNNNGGYGLLMGYDNANGYARIRNVSNTALTFETNNVERVRITSGGNIGIGNNNTSPINALDIRISSSSIYSSNSAGNVLTLYNTSATTGAYSGIDFISEPTSGNAGRAAINLVVTGSGTGNLCFSTRNTTLEERMKITSVGDVNIKNGTITTGVSIAIAAINTAYVLKAGAYSGLVVIRDNTNGGSGVWITDPNMGTIQIANNMPGAFTIGWNGSNTMITKTSGNTINISVGFYSNILG
jgi:hypothetical protein